MRPWLMKAYYDGAVTDDTKDYLDAFCKRLIYVFILQ
jgi:hypothetical protein